MLAAVQPPQTPGPVISASGSRVAYRGVEDQKSPIYAVSISGVPSSGIAQKICDDCGIPFDWSRDEKRILYLDRKANKMFWLDLVSHRQVETPEFPGIPSPDGHWVVYATPSRAGLSRLFVAAGHSLEKPGEPLPLTDGQSWDHAPRWSPNGNLVYFLSDRDGFRCLWAVRLNPVTKLPIEGPFPAAHFHEARRSALDLPQAELGLGVARNKAVFVLNDRAGSIWMAEVEEER
jgi:hypothetical protein